MSNSFFLCVICSSVLATSFALAAPPSNAPAGSTGLCQDGTYYSGATKKGACTGHLGVKEWWGTAGAVTTPSSSTAHTKVAGGGGPGQVWANSSTKTYHCQGDKWYGKTSSGSYMSESEAKAKGYHPDHGKACQ
ncbi:DUF3761 domain-containing protein [Peristeroidobacter soli]|jgi:hypothetical protein|uniref:DUF3761 domain-containing protein n=1 Tax=Peristeroidobacter soli TaxID=2497877 RepID=UPI00101D9155|nr:DUF3761 domain-containing protein [Peristeroidobacter soli]